MHTILEELPSTVLLATACVTIRASDGTEHIAHALLDISSQASFISEPAQLLKQSEIRHQFESTVLDLVKQEPLVESYVLQSADPTMHLVIGALVLNRITAYLPNRDLNHQFPHLDGLELAYKEFHKPGKIDILLGADVYGHVIMDGVLRGA